MIDLVEVLSKLELDNITEKREEVFFSCPFPEHWRGDKNPSASINKDTLAYYCFSCGKKGTLFTLISKLKGVSSTQAVRWIRQKYPQAEEEEHFSSRLSRVVYPEHKEEIKYIDSKFIDKFWVNWGMAYEAYKKGDCPNPLAYLFDEGIMPDTLEKYNIGWDRLEKRVVFPWKDIDGNLVGFKGRAMNGRLPRYKILGDIETERYGFPMLKVKDHVYGLDTAEGELIIVEGEKDMISMRQKGFEQTVALGSCQITKPQAKLLRQKAEKVIVIFDGDLAGREGAMKIAEALFPVVDVKMVWLGEDTDPTNLSREDIQKALESARNSIEEMFV